jgi:hypothetical protein
VFPIHSLTSPLFLQDGIFLNILPLVTLNSAKSRIENTVLVQLRRDRFFVDAEPKIPAVAIWNIGNANPNGG